MTKPTIHLNGTSAEDLTEQYSAAITAVGDAITALRNCTPHGRDYYVQGSDQILAACDEHFDRIKRLQSVSAELEELGMHCASFIK